MCSNIQARFATTTEALRSFFKCAAAAAWNDIRAAKNEEERKLTQRPYVTSILRQHLKLAPNVGDDDGDEMDLPKKRKRKLFTSTDVMM
ncbi:hypothetical protein T08_15671 [Trichinella sp. T8]|nr:hypothetical protein T08_15671 [Trichinella sp. T8]